MIWTRVLVLLLLATLLILSFSGVVENAAVRDDSRPDRPEGVARQIFMPESDASNFFKRRSRRSTRYYELQAEQRVKVRQSEQRREYNEEQSNEYHNYIKEYRDEINERTRETNEQIREYHYDGLYPRFYWFH
ncbi:upper zone of growth plate and cartilage matrix associated a [Salarias fasciatus]|uniref:Unique cartilage matrix-associated protein n=1 Tax=Salarias fasciatus TaxID=181472 RepID=A0A672J7M8_SALFA|nr:unique cartilage matrix-associated protein-like [Salarias fasciatus]